VSRVPQQLNLLNRESHRTCVLRRATLSAQSIPAKQNRTPVHTAIGQQADALGLGAERLLISSDAEAMTRAASSFDLIIDTVPARHDLTPYVPLLDVDGTLVIVGQLGPIAETSTFPLIPGGVASRAPPRAGCARPRSCSTSARASTSTPTAS
jgi:hypothetical protein